MRYGLRERLSYANVMATVALFAALGGGAYAANLAKNLGTGSKTETRQLSAGGSR